MIPLLLGAGRMLLMSGAKGAAKGAITKTFKDKAIDAGKDKIVSVAKDKAKDARKRISAKKLFAKTQSAGNKMKKGRGLILRKSSAIVKQSKGALVKTTEGKNAGDGGKGGAIVKSSNIRDEILKELEKIKVDVIKVKEISTQKLLNQKEQDQQRYLELRKKKSEEQEKDLEEKKDTKKKKKLGITAPRVGLFDMIKRFLLNVLIGSLLNYLLKHGPTILNMFKDIGKGLTNTWNVLKLGIITLTTLFPKQIKFLAKLTSVIIGPPAKLIGKLLLKAGRVAGNLFKKAGGVIFNLIKGPLSSLVKKVGGEALEQGAKTAAKGAAKFAGRAAGAVGGALKSPAAAKIIKRLKSFSKIFKRVPVVGALIGIGIDLALGEKLDRAIVGAIGASLGAGIGGAIGQGLIPIPVVGAAVGGFVGAGIGEWAAKKLYGDLTGRVAEADKENPIERRAFGGSVNVRGGSSRSLPRANTAIQRRTTSTSGLSKQTLEKAKGTLLKDEESAKRFANLSSAYGAIPFVGEAMKLGLDVSLGERVSKSRTDAIAESIGSTIGMALKNDEFSVRGFNKRIIGEFSKNLTTWAKRKIFVSVKSQENQFKSLQEKKEEAAKAGGTEGGADGGEDLGPIEEIKPGTMHQKGAQIAKNLMRLLNIKDYQAAGIVGNLIQESSLVPDRIQGSGMKRGPLKLDGVTGYSYPQWTSIDRQKAFANYMEKKGFDWRTKGATDEMATGFLAQEFKGYMSNVFTNTKDAATASNWVLKNYEKPADQGPREQKERAQDSVAVLKKMGGQGGGNGIKRHKVPFLAMGGNHVVTSSMGLRNFALSPGMHMGVDIAGSRGEPLQAFTDGVVEATGYDGGYGNWVNWIDNKGIGHFYGHMDKKASVKAGQRVKKGTILGPLGNTGRSSGPHLHWEAATNPRDNGMPKSNVLSRFNPLSKYNKESPFGGSIQPDPSSASSDIASSSSASPGSPDSSAPSEQPSEFAKNFMVLGDPAAKKGGGMGGGSGIDLWGISPSRNSKLGKNSGFGDVPAHHRSYTTEAGLPRDYAVVKSGVNPVANPSAGRGENVVAGVSGKVTFAGFAGGAGNHVVISSGGKQIIRLLHLDKILARNGQSVNPSTVIGTQGNSGTRDIHVHVDGSQAVHTNWIKAMLGGQYEANPSAGSGESGSPSAPGAQPEPPEMPSEFAKNFMVLGDPSIKKSTVDQISQTPSYDKSNQALLIAQAPAGGTSMPPVRSKSGGLDSVTGAMGAGSVVNSYGMVSRQIISSSLYKL